MNYLLAALELNLPTIELSLTAANVFICNFLIHRALKDQLVQQNRLFLIVTQLCDILESVSGQICDVVIAAQFSG